MRDYLPKNRFEWFCFILMLFSLFVNIFTCYFIFDFADIDLDWNNIFGVVGLLSLGLAIYYQRKNEKSNNIFRKEAGFYHILSAEFINPSMRVRSYQTYLEDAVFPLSEKEECYKKVKKYLKFILNVIIACDVKYVNSFKFDGKAVEKQPVIVTANLMSDYYMWRQEQNNQWRQMTFVQWFIDRFNTRSKKGFIVTNSIKTPLKISWSRNYDHCSLRGDGSKDFDLIDFEKYMDQIFNNLNSLSTFCLVPSKISS